MTGDDARLGELAQRLHASLRARASTVAVGESLTGGLVGAVLTDAAGASVTFLGGVTAYATPAKAALLDVDAQLLRRVGPVDPDVAVAMARGVRGRFGATYGLATTGVAGPDPADGKPAGTVHVAVAWGTGHDVRSLQLEGGRDRVRRLAVGAVLELALDCLGNIADAGEALE